MWRMLLQDSFPVVKAKVAHTALGTWAQWGQCSLGSVLVSDRGRARGMSAVAVPGPGAHLSLGPVRREGTGPAGEPSQPPRSWGPLGKDEPHNHEQGDPGGWEEVRVPVAHRPAQGTGRTRTPSTYVTPGDRWEAGWDPRSLV